MLAGEWWKVEVAWYRKNTRTQQQWHGGMVGSSTWGGLVAQQGMQLSVEAHQQSVVRGTEQHRYQTHQSHPVVPSAI